MVIISIWLGGLLSFGIIGGGIYLTYEWYRRAWAYNPQLDRYDFAPNLGLNVPTALLAAGILLLVWTVAGGVIVRWLAGLMSRSHAAGDRPWYRREGVVHRLPRPDGSELQVEFITGFQPHAPPAVLARGMFGMLGYDATETLPTIDVPTLVVYGDRDSTCVPQASERIHQDVPASQLVPLTPAKHLGLIEHNERFAELVRAFAVGCFQATRPRQPMERTV